MPQRAARHPEIRGVWQIERHVPQEIVLQLGAAAGTREVHLAVEPEQLVAAIAARALGCAERQHRAVEVDEVRARAGRRDIDGLPPRSAFEVNVGPGQRRVVCVHAALGSVLAQEMDVMR